MIRHDILVKLVATINAKSMPIPECGCIVFNGCWTKAGYGNIGMTVDNKPRNFRTHSVMYEAAFGPVPDGLEIDHKCRVRSCCNPDHLEAVTHHENMMRGHTVVAINKRKTHCPRGHLLSYFGTKGYRRCKTCDAIVHNQRYHAAKN